MEKIDHNKNDEYITKNENEGVNSSNKSFIGLYTELYNKYFDELESLRKTQRNQIVFIFFAVVASIILINIFPILIPLFVVGIFSLIITTIVKSIKSFSGAIKGDTSYIESINKKQNYKVLFKEKIITPVIEYALPSCEYFYYAGISRLDYVRGEWEYFDIFHSEDKITTNLDVDNVDKEIILVISEVHTQDESKDSEGHTTYTTVFHGLAGYINLPKDIGCNIKVIKNRVKLFGSGKNKLEMDMPEFEKMFDVETDDRIKAMQLLTSDVMVDFLSLINASKVKFEFNIKNNIMHIRFHTGGMFEPATFGRAMQLDMLRKYYDIVVRVREISEKICNIVNETEM